MDMTTTQQLSEQYPSVEIPGPAGKGHRLHVFRDDDGWAVWLNTEVGDFDGLCLCTREDTLPHAITKASAVLQAAAERLQSGPWLEAPEEGT